MRRESTPHYYKQTYTVRGQRREAVFQQWRRNPAPGSNHDEPVENGSTSSVPLLGGVEHEVDTEQYTVTNTTMRGHLLYPGSVTASFSQQGEDTLVTVVGQGTGPYGRVNEILSRPLWGRQVSGIEWSLLSSEEKTERSMARFKAATDSSNNQF